MSQPWEKKNKTVPNERDLRIHGTSPIEASESSDELVSRILLKEINNVISECVYIPKYKAASEKN